MSVECELEEDLVEDEERADKENQSPEGDAGELKITVRKLEVPVRPRGVLAQSELRLEAAPVMADGNGPLIHVSRFA